MTGGSHLGRLGWGQAPTARSVIAGIPQVEVEVESMDKAGNFIGWLHIEGVNLSVALVEQALSRVHFTAERSPYCKALLAAQDAAKQRKEKVRGHRGPTQPWHRPRNTSPSPRWPRHALRDVPTKGCPRAKDGPILRDVKGTFPSQGVAGGHSPGSVTAPVNVPAHHRVAPPAWMSPSQEMFHPKEHSHSWRCPHPKE